MNPSPRERELEERCAYLETLLAEAQTTAHDLAVDLAEAAERHSITLERKANLMRDYLRLTRRCHDWYNASKAHLDVLPERYKGERHTRGGGPDPVDRIRWMVEEGPCPE